MSPYFWKYSSSIWSSQHLWEAGFASKRTVWTWRSPFAFWQSLLTLPIVSGPWALKFVVWTLPYTDTSSLGPTPLNLMCGKLVTTGYTSTHWDTRKWDYSEQDKERKKSDKLVQRWGFKQLSGTNALWKQISVCVYHTWGLFRPMVSYSKWKQCD